MAFLWQSEGCHGCEDSLAEAIHWIEQTTGEKCVASPVGWRRAKPPFSEKMVIDVITTGEIIIPYGPEKAIPARMAAAARTKGGVVGNVMANPEETA